MIKVIFVCLVSCCSWFMPLKDNLNCEKQDQIQEVEEKTRNNFYQEGEYFAIGCSEIIDIDTLNYIFRDSPSFFQTSTVGSTYSMFEYMTDTRLVSISNYNPTLTDLGYSTGLSVNVFNFELVGFRDDFSYCKFQEWKLSVKHSDSPTINMSNNFYLTYNNTSSNTSIVSMQVKSSLVGTYGNYLIVSKNENFKNVFIEKYYNASYNSGYNNGYEEGYSTGYDEGEERGKEIAQDPASEIYQNTYDVGHQAGYAEGIAYSQEQSSTALTIFTGIIEVGLLPVNVFLKMFEYEVFGINIAGLISGLLTISMIMIFIRFIFGGKDNGK